MRVAVYALLLSLLAACALASEPRGLLTGEDSGGAPPPDVLLVPDADKACGKAGAAPCPSATGADPGKLLVPGQKPPSLTIQDLDGKPFLLDPERAAKPSLVIFWSIFCEPCKEEFPLFHQIAGDYADKSLNVVAVNLDGPDMARASRNFLKMNKYALPVAVDRKEGKRSFAAEAYGVTGTPSLFLTGKDGVIRWSHVGRVEPEKIEAEIKGVLETGGAASASAPKGEGK